MAEQDDDALELADNQDKKGGKKKILILVIGVV